MLFSHLSVACFVVKYVFSFICIEHILCVILCKKQRNSILCAVTDLAMNAVKEDYLPVEETDDSCIFKYCEIVPLATDTDVSSTTECVSGDGSSEVRQEILTSVKQEPDDVCWFCYSIHVFSLSQQKQFLHVLVNVF